MTWGKYPATTAGSGSVTTMTGRKMSLCDVKSIFRVFVLVGLPKSSEENTNNDSQDTDTCILCFGKDLDQTIEEGKKP